MREIFFGIFFYAFVGSYTVGRLGSHVFINVMSKTPQILKTKCFIFYYTFFIKYLF